MIDASLWELLVVGLVALLVVGPERLPKLAYTAGKWFGKGRSMLSSMKREIDKEIKAEELKSVLEEQKRKINPLEDVIEETSSVVQDLKKETETAIQEAQTDTKAESAEADSSAKNIET